MFDLSQCTLCPRNCRADRTRGGRGYCGAGDAAQVFRFGPHRGEEPPISGTRGSGTVFFSRCTMRCCYCQNFPWSAGGAGERYDADGLAAILARLRDAGCHNWNLVSPTPWLPMIAEALARQKSNSARLPVVYNTSGFERVETLRRIEGLVDVYLTDLRYAERATAAAASDVPAYVETARTALLEMWRQTGPMRTDADGIASRGTICRVLILPGHADEAVRNLAWLAEHVGRDAAVSVMAQYIPAHRATQPPWNRPIARDEYDRVVDAVEAYGFDQGWVQDFEPAPSPALAGFAMAPEALTREAGT